MLSFGVGRRRNLVIVRHASKRHKSTFDPLRCIASGACYTLLMTKLLQEALEVLKEMPEDRQETVARAIINYAEEDDAVHLTDEQIVEVKRRIANPNRKIISLEEVHTLCDALCAGPLNQPNLASAKHPPGLRHGTPDHSQRMPCCVYAVYNGRLECAKSLIYWSERGDLNSRPPVPQRQ